MLLRSRIPFCSAVQFPAARHSTHTTLSRENRALTFSINDPYKCLSHNARLHDVHTPPDPALKKILHLSHCQLNVDWRKNGGTYTIARV
jgi:hypothetical protein